MRSSWLVPDRTVPCCMNDVYLPKNVHARDDGHSGASLIAPLSWYLSRGDI